MTKKSIAKNQKKLSITKKTMQKNTKKKIVKKVVAKPKKKVLAIPKNYHSIIPCLITNSAAKAIDFYKKAFDAKEVIRIEHSGNKVMYAELKIGDSKIMLGDESPEMNLRSPKAYGGSPMSIHLYVKNVDATVDKAVSAGAKIIRPTENKFYGDRSATVEDPYGYHWCVSTHIEDVTPAQIKKRAAELLSKKL